MDAGVNHKFYFGDFFLNKLEKLVLLEYSRNRQTFIAAFLWLFKKNPLIEFPGMTFVFVFLLYRSDVKL